MASMDNLRDKIRSRRGSTNELLETSNPFKQAFDETPTPATPPGKSQTDSLISDIFADDAEQQTFQAHFDEPEAPPVQPSQKSKEPSKNNFKLPFAGRFKHLEVNRKMLMISLGVAALASFLSMAYLKGIAEPLKGQSQMIKVVSLTKDVPARTALSEDMLTIKEVPAAYLPAGSVAYKPDMKLLGQVTLTSMYKGEVLHEQRISLPNSQTGISSLIPVGHRVFSVPTNEAYKLKPSTADRKEYVDVIATIPDPNPVRRGRLITIPILQRAMVLAVGGSFSPEELNEKTSNPIDITLAVPEDRINLMVILKEKGDFSVILRSPDDTNTQREKYTVEEIENALQGKFEAEKIEAEAPPPASTQTVKEEEPAPPAAAPLVDLSQPAAPAYRAPARQPVRQPARQPVRQQPVRKPAAAPKPVAPRPAAPAAAPAQPRRAPVVINGGVITQGGN